VAQIIGLHIQTRDGRTIDAVHDSDSILIGSGPSAVLRLEDPNVSSIHAVIKVTPDGVVTIIDLGSEAGTTVNGNAVTEPQRLAVGDQILVGGAKIIVTQLGAAPKAHQLADGEITARTDVKAPKAPEPRTVAAPPPAQKPASQPRAHVEPQRAHVDQSTQVIREREAGSRIVRKDDAIDTAVITTPLSDHARPTNEEHVLEVTVLWGDSVVDTCQVGEPRGVTVGPRQGDPLLRYFIGNSHKTDLEVEGDFPLEHWVVAYNRGSAAEVVIPAAGTYAVRKADGTISKGTASGSQNLQIGLQDRAVFKAGTLTFVTQFVRGNAAMGRGDVMDWYFPRVFTISALVHLFFVIAAFITPQLEGSLVDELFKNQNRFAQMILKAPEKEKKRKKLDLSGMKGGGKHKGEEGKFGKKDLPKKDALASKAGAPRVDPNKREKDRKIAMNAGLLGILKGSAGQGAVSNVFGPGGLGTGINNAMGGLRGTEMGDAGGAGGLGTRGTGAGGGGNSLGIGGLGTHGGRGTGGYGNIDLGGRGKGTTRIVPGRTIIKGSLSKEEIGRVIRRNLARFKYCYEKELNANPNLSGKIAVYFTIAPTGAVAEASVRETSMNDSNVETCVLKVMRSLKFPKPRGGGIVVVTYPFVFAST
jgi:pSer/pThr/pTyr-binding forkhead associated (FHA) protein